MSSEEFKKELDKYLAGKSKVSAYFSHSIRGAKGMKATDKDIEENCKDAIKMAEWIRENVPGLDLYVPAEHEDFVHIAYKDEYLSEEQILEIDCKILERKDFHIVRGIDKERSRGTVIEIEYAKKAGKFTFYVFTMDEVEAAALRVIVKDFQRAKSK